MIKPFDIKRPEDFSEEEFLEFLRHEIPSSHVEYVVDVMKANTKMINLINELDLDQIRSHLKHLSLSKWAESEGKTADKNNTLLGDIFRMANELKESGMEIEKE